MHIVHNSHTCIELNCILHRRFLLQIKILGKLISSDSAIFNYPNENISVVIGFGCGVIILWWSWLPPPAAIHNYHVAIWIIASCGQPLSYRSHTQVNLKGTSSVGKGSKLHKTNLHGISMSSSIRQIIILWM